MNFEQVWCWDGDGRSPLMGSEVIKFCSRYCYIFSYSYTGELGEQHVVGTWFGRQSLEVMLTIIFCSSFW